MILQALTRYYEQMEAEGKLPEEGFCFARVSWGLELSQQGELLRVLPLKEQVPRGEKTVDVPRQMIVPQQEVRTGNAVPYNVLTVQGENLHERAHDALATEKRGNLLVSRGMPVRSRTLGVNGVCDVVEFHMDKEGVSLFGRAGSWLPVPVEYKRGAPAPADESDSLQLCCQAMCLEEMLLCPPIPQAYLYYFETAHRFPVTLDGTLREKVGALLKEMHALYRRHYTPRVRLTKACRSCSLNGLCLPKLDRIGPVSAYLKKRLEELP